MISGEDLKRLRDRRGWTQSQLGDALNVALGRNYGTGTISPWETGRRSIPADVQAFVEELMIETALPPEEPPKSPEDAGGLEASDTAPGSGGAATVAGQPPLMSGGIYTRACTELWQIIASGVGMVGAATGSAALVSDGAIIDADKEALGAAWGRLAETNETFRKMLVGMTEGGAWIQVALVTGTTMSRCYQNHAQYALLAGRNGDSADVPAAAA